MRTEAPVGWVQDAGLSPFVSAQQVVNCYLEKTTDGKTVLIGGPGLKSFAAPAGSGEVRGIGKRAGGLLVVRGGSLYTVSSAGVAVNRGAIAGGGPVLIVENGTQAAIITNSTDYVWDGATLSAITDPDFVGAGTADFIDQYLVFTRPNTAQWGASALANFAAYDALDIATAEARPDQLRRVIVSNRDVLLMGEETTEFWYNSGDNDFPFARSQSFVEYGTAGAHCVAALDNTVVWLAHDLTVRAIRGGTPERISTHAIDQEIRKWSNPGDAVAFAFAFGGHTMFALRHVEGCFIWDAASGGWTRRRSQGSTTWRATCAVQCYGKTLLGDANGLVWELDPDTHTEGASELVREFVTPQASNGTRFDLDAYELVIETGATALMTGQGSDPKVWLECSRDGGRTFGNRLERSIGRAGETDQTVIWRRLGQMPMRGGCVRVGMSDPVRFAVVQAWADVSEPAG